MSEKMKDQKLENGSVQTGPEENQFSTESFSENIEKVTEDLLSQWEISEDDFEDTQDLTAAARQISAAEAQEKAKTDGSQREKAARASQHPAQGVHRETRSSAGTGKERSSAEKQKAQTVRHSRSSQENGGSRSGERRLAEKEGRSNGRRTAEKEGRSGERRTVEKEGRSGERRLAEKEGQSSGRRTAEKESRSGECRPIEKEKRSSEHRAAEKEERSGAARKSTAQSGAARKSTGQGRKDFSGKTGTSGKKTGSRRKQQNPVLAFWSSLQPMDKVVGITGIAVCLFAVLTFSVVIQARNTDRQVAAFAEVGEELAQISVADEGTFLAVADGHMSRQQAADILEEETESGEYDEKDDTSAISVGLNMTSVEKDLKIKFVNRKTGKLIPHVAFQVEIKGPDKTYQKADEDEDGIIYLTGLTGGSYTVRVTGPEGLEGYSLPEEAQAVTVKNQIEFKKIDVSDEIKSEAEVNAAQEDTEIKTQVESTVQDTVEWVESTKTAIGVNGTSEGAYTEVKKADVPDPAATASIDFALFAGIKSQGTQLLLSSANLDEGISPVTETTTTTTEPTTSEPATTPSTEPNTDHNPEIAVTGVSINPGSQTGTVGGTVSFSAAVSPENASNKNVTWSSDNESVASVSNGTVSCKSAGTATITVTTADSGFTASATVVVNEEKKSVTGVEVTGADSVTAGSSISLGVTVTPSDASYDGVSWTSSNTGVATVSGGTVTGVKAGDVTITATAGGVSGTKQIKVTAAEIVLSSIKITGSSSAKKGESVQLSVTAEPAGADASVTWKSSNTSVATISDTGKVTCVATGNTTITATSKKDPSKTATLAFTVTSNESNTLTANDTTVTAGETKKADYTAANVSSTSFSVANTKYATIDGNGNIKGIRAGETTYTVTVKFKDGNTSTATKKLIVKAAAVSKITLDKTSVTLKVGESLKLNPTITTSGYTGCLWYTSDASIVTVTEHGNGTITAVKAGKATITACSSEDTSKKATCEVTVTGGTDPKTDTTTPLKDKNGKQLYIKNSAGQYVAAVVADYYKYDVFYLVNENVEYKYTGWQTIDGKRYFFDKNGNKVTGEQIIQGVKYTFGSDGALNAGSGVLGIDVSKHNGSINWTEVKNSGVSFVIIRCGYRGSSTGAMIEDPKFKSNIQGATSAGLKVGVYFFSQAVNRVEAVEEASMTIELIKNYKISYPVFLDVEAAGGRADGVDAATRTEIVNAYCQTIRSSGYTAGVYANKTWLGSKMNVGSFGSNKIWLAQYAATPTYNGRYEMWQYSSKGKISGISGNVDLNISYLGY